MKPAIRKRQPADEVLTAEQCHILELSNHPDDPVVSIARARVEPGVSTRWHRLRGISERYLILNGKGRVEIGDLPPQEVTTGDTVIIPPMCRQRITNHGDRDLIFLAVCTPRFTPDIYEDIE